MAGGKEAIERGGERERAEGERGEGEGREEERCVYRQPYELVL